MHLSLPSPHSLQDTSSSSQAAALARSMAGPSVAAPAEWDAIFGGAAGPSTLPGMGLPGGPVMGHPAPLPPGALLGPGPPPPPAITAHLQHFFLAAKAGAPAGGAGGGPGASHARPGAGGCTIEARGSGPHTAGGTMGIS